MNSIISFLTVLLQAFAAICVCMAVVRVLFHLGCGFFGLIFGAIAVALDVLASAIDCSLLLRNAALRIGNLADTINKVDRKSVV